MSFFVTDIAPVQPRSPEHRRSPEDAGSNGRVSHAEEVVEEVARAGVGTIAMGAGGASIGSAAGPSGAVIGAIVGALIGVIARLFGRPRTRRPVL